MTEQSSSIIPPLKLVQQWFLSAPVDQWVTDVATQAACWGADQELEACCLWMKRNFDDWGDRYSAELHASRRPKPPSLKEQALAELETIMDELHEATGSGFTASVIHRALEQLPE